MSQKSSENNPNSQKRSLSCFLSYIDPKGLDMIGTEFKLKYGNKETFQTRVGGLLTVAVVVVTLGAFYATLNSFMLDPKPEVSSSTKYSKKSPRFDLYKEGIILSLSFLDPTVGAQGFASASKYFTIRAEIKSYTIDPVTTAPISKIEIEIPYKPCLEVKDKNPILPFLSQSQSSQITKTFGLCPDLDGLSDKYFIQSKFQSPPFHELNIYLYPCSLPNQADCASGQQVASSLLYFSNIRKGFDPDNRTEPVSTIPEFDGTLRFDPRSTKHLSYLVRSNEIWDDTFDFFDSRLSHEYADYTLSMKDEAQRDPTQFYCTSQMVQTGDFRCQPYIVFNWISSGETLVIKRTYSKFFGSLGEVGGTTEILILFSVVAYAAYNRYFASSFVKKELFYSSKEETKKIIEVFRNGSRDYDMVAKRNMGLSRVPESPSGAMRGGFSAGFSSSQNFKKNENERFLGTRRAGDGKREEEMVLRMIANNYSNNEDGISMYKKLNRLEVLESILFEEHDKVLMPLVLINLMRSKEEGLSGRGSRFGKKRVHPAPRNILGGGRSNMDGKEVEKGQNKMLKGSEGAGSSLERKMTLEEAYESLVNSEPESEIKKLIREFILSNLPPGIQSMRRGVPELAKRSSSLKAADFNDFELKGEEEEKIEDLESQGSQKSISSHQKNIAESPLTSMKVKTEIKDPNTPRRRIVMQRVNKNNRTGQSTNGSSHQISRIFVRGAPPKVTKQRLSRLGVGKSNLSEQRQNLKDR